MVKIIDAHSHYMPPEVAQHTAFFKVNWSDIDRQLSMMDELGIEKSLLLYPTSDAHIQMGGWSNVCRVYNQEIGNIVHQHQNRFIGAGIIPADDPNAFEDELKRIEDLAIESHFFSIKL